MSSAISASRWAARRGVGGGEDGGRESTRASSGVGAGKRAAELVRGGKGCELARELAARHADAAVAALRELPPPAHEHGAACRVALESLAKAVVQRKK